MNRSTRVRLSKLSLGLIAALAVAPAFAQSTSAGVGGIVTDASGQPVAGAEVTILHVESGTVSRATTDASGRYNARGLRVGGPYTITVNQGGRSDTEDNVYLSLNQVNTINAQLGAPATLDTVVVTGSAMGYVDAFGADKMGTGSNVNRAQIDALPSIGRDIQDYIRLDPRISQTSKGRGEISAGGQNTRFNAIRVDGVSASDTFGLESNNSPTMRQPVSIDAIQEVNIGLADYDVTTTGATGAVVNAVTRSGTNNFSGSVYGAYRDQDWVRANADGSVFNGFIDEKTWGATFGGPIMRDRLFFFLNYEKFTRAAPGTTVSSAANAITEAQMQQVRNIAQQRYGVDIGNWNAPENLKTELEEFAGKIDWNITDNHRASLRLSRVEQADVFLYGFSPTGRSLSSNWSVTNKTVDSYVAQLFSDWSPNFSTELKASYRKYDAVRNPLSRLPSVGIGFGTPTNQGTAASPFLNFGTDVFSHYNVLNTDTLNLFGAATWHVGDHELKFGFDHEKNSIYNLFGSVQFGQYTFNSIADFEAGRYSAYTKNSPQPGAPLDSIAAKYDQSNLGLFVQDRWMVNNNLSLMFGLRMDRLGIDQVPIYNPLVQRVYGYDNSVTMDGSNLVQPRFGFNYQFDSERPTQLRGGVGLFQGAAANVWVGNSFANTGLNIVTYGTPSGFASQPLAVRQAFWAANPFSMNPDNQPQPSNSQQMVVNLMDPGFKQPSVWKANLAFDHELPWQGIVASAELLLTQVNNGIHYERLDLGAPTAVGHDGRLFYWGNLATASNPRANANREINALRAAGQMPPGMQNVSGWGGNGVILMRNTNEGQSKQLTVSLQRPLIDSWSWMLGYTYTQATEVSPLTSSQAHSNWNNKVVLNGNDDIAARSNYEIRDRFTGALTWQRALFGDNKTTISAFYEGRSGKPYSWSFSNDANGDSRVNDLFYMPAAWGDVLFTGGAAMEQAFWDYASQYSDLMRYRGSVVERNSARSRWVNNFDVRISQELPGFFDGHKSEVWLDILNVGNLINKDWGQVYEVGFPLARSVAQFRGIDPATGKYIYSFVNGGSGNTVGNMDLYDNQDQTKGVSRWQLQLGFRYKF